VRYGWAVPTHPEGLKPAFVSPELFQTVPEHFLVDLHLSSELFSVLIAAFPKLAS